MQNDQCSLQLIIKRARVHSQLLFCALLSWRQLLVWFFIRNVVGSGDMDFALDLLAVQAVAVKHSEVTDLMC